jgi:hypothetical protein
MTRAAFDAVVNFLNAGGTNYTVFLRTYQTDTTSGESTMDAVRRAVGEGVSVERVQAASVHEVLAEVTSSLAYAGDASAGPDPADLLSAEFRRLLADVIEKVCALAEGAIRIEQFRFKDGHPAYPVFWDFAFLFVAPHQSTVLVGSSSD